MGDRTGNVLTFTRRQINEWPKSVYLADLGDGEGCRPYTHIQHPDDTTPEYVRYDLYFAAVAERDRLQRESQALLNALDPSAETKVTYSAEIGCDCSDHIPPHYVPWTSIKDIMRMIREKATLSAREGE